MSGLFEPSNSALITILQMFARVSKDLALRTDRDFSVVSEYVAASNFSNDADLSAALQRTDATVQMLQGIAEVSVFLLRRARTNSSELSVDDIEAALATVGVSQLRRILAGQEAAMPSDDIDIWE